MPEGVVVTVDDGFATIDFVDRKRRGPGLRKLVELYGPEVIETLTRQGPRRLYRVPEGNAREAGLIDSEPPMEVPHRRREHHRHEVRWVPPQEPVAPTPVEAVVGPNYDGGKPDHDWHRSALDEYAVKLGLNPKDYSNKGLILAAIRERDTQG